MRTIEILLIIVTITVCLGIGFYITWVNRGYERRRREEAARKKPLGTESLPTDTPPG